jgi:hypothetical protein
LRWVLRDFPNATFTAQPNLDARPTLLITTQDQEIPALADAYRGQDFAWRAYPGWTGDLPPNLPAWLTFREAPVIYDQVILWARADLFPGESQ